MNARKFQSLFLRGIMFVSFSAANMFLYAQDDPIFDVPYENSETPAGEDSAKTSKLKNTNIDAEFMYGQYNNISSNFSIIQGFDSFAYQLNTDYKRSNDFGGYKNSSFYDNAIELTGQTEIFDTFTFIPLVDVRNESHGMFLNNVYSREEKDRFIVLLKNEYKPTPTRWQLNVGGTQYIHRLVGASVDETEFDKFNEEIEWEHVFSTSQKVTLRHYSCQYFYSSNMMEADADFHMVNELMWSVKLFEYLKLSLSPMAIWNRDEEWLPGGRVQLDSDSLKFVTLELAFAHELVPFLPEELYYAQKYVKPSAILPPQKVDRAEFNGTILFQRKSDADLYLKSFKLKSKNTYEDNNNFYNYTQAPAGNVIEPGTISAVSFSSSNDSSLDFLMYSYILSFNIGYIYSKYTADDYITYRPSHKFTSSVSLNSDKWSLAWGNDYSSSVYVETNGSAKLDGALIGSMVLQVQVVESVLLNLKMENLYNDHYRYRDGYPEPGFTILGGLRILL